MQVGRCCDIPSRCMTRRRAPAAADDDERADDFVPADDVVDRRRRRALHAAGLLLLVALVFGRIVGHEFINLDDDKFLYANPNFLPPTLAGLADHWEHPYRHLYAPVAMTAWWLIA